MLETVHFYCTRIFKEATAEFNYQNSQKLCIFSPVALRKSDIPECSVEMLLIIPAHEFPHSLVAE